MKYLLIFFVLINSLNAGSFKLIEKKEFKDKWAFTVDKVRIGCQNQLPIVEANNKTYGLTGFAAKMVGQDITPIWAENKYIKGLKANIQPFIDIALSMCKK